MATLPKLALAGVAERRPCTPVPLNATVKLGSEALLVIAILPVAAPAVAGAKWGSRLMLCPAASFNGVATVLIEKPLPLTLMREMLTTVIPEFVRVTVLVLLLATPTVPKVKLPGAATSFGLAAALVRRAKIASIRVAMEIRVNVFFLHTHL